MGGGGTISDGDTTGAQTHFGGKKFTVTAAGDDALLLGSNFQKNIEIVDEGDISMGAVIELLDETDANEEFRIEVGFTDGFVGTSTSGVYFLVDNATTSFNWWGYVRNGGSTTTYNTNTAAAVGKIKLRVDVLADADGAGNQGAFFYINEVRQNSTPITTNIPTGVDLDARVSLTKVTASANVQKEIYVWAVQHGRRLPNLEP